MSVADYHIVSRWRVSATLDEVATIFRDSSSLVDWWPAAFLGARVECDGGENEAGKVVALHTKGWLPYTLRLRFQVVEVNYPRKFELRCWGDFEGGAVCTLVRIDDEVSLTFDWRVRVHKPLIRALSFSFKPIFAANHRWVMRRGRESLELELKRRRAWESGVLEEIPPPPGPTFPHSLLYGGVHRKPLLPIRAKRPA